jgi:hypothetical protein
MVRHYKQREEGGLRTRYNDAEKSIQKHDMDGKGEGGRRCHREGEDSGFKPEYHPFLSRNIRSTCEIREKEVI